MKQTLQSKPELLQKHFSYAGQKKQLDILTRNRSSLLGLIRTHASRNPWIILPEETIDYVDSAPREDLYSHMMSQISAEEGADEEILIYLIGRLDSSGYFQVPLEELNLYPQDRILEQIEIGRHLDPVGCFAFSLKDCLLPQIEESHSPWSKQAIILLDHLELIASKDLSRLSRITHLSPDEISEALGLIRSCNPRPASNYDTGSDYLYPDCEIIKNGNTLEVKLPSDLSFTLDEHLDAKESEELAALRQDAVVLLNALERRNLTFLQLMNFLVSQQKEWFFKGDRKYLTLKDAAAACSLHPSTIWRTASTKGFLYENRIYPISFLFRSDGTEQVSRSRIEEIIRQLIASEDPKEPYSDEALAFLLGRKGISISRRAIAKYRRQLRIPSSYQRRKNSSSKP